MSKKKVDPIKVEVDEVGLSVLGWEINNFQARLLTNDYGDVAFHEVATSMELRFHPDDWEVRHSGRSDYVPDLIWQIRSRSLGALSPYSWASTIYKPKELRAPKLASETSRTWEERRPHDPNDLYVWVGAYDWTECDSRAEPSARWQDVEHEFVDHRTLKGVGSEVTEISTRIEDERLTVTLRMIHPIGSIEDLMTAGHDYEEWAVDLDRGPEEQDEFEVPGPDVIIQLFDETGFLLDSRENERIGHISVGKGGQRPTRPPSSVTVTNFDLDDLAGKVARIVVRLQDPTS
ncbi:hypothetical protein [Nocardioides aquiterrae]|uniref:Uncharacterized protein n=1 Tax=Nocardioides aquiterrae TaxID=203799 RepID=A0ABN1U8Y5_9ACTN